MYKGTVIENSLTDSTVLNGLSIYRSWEAGDWKLHEVTVSYADILRLQKHIADGPWYMHFWATNKDDVIVVFKEALFPVIHSDKRSWEPAITYGIELGIPEAQLDFLIDE